MFRNLSISLFIVIFTVSCVAYGDKKHSPPGDVAAKSTTQQEQTDTDILPDSGSISGNGWRPFKGVLLRHIVANCCFSESQNTVILGQDNNRDQQVDTCYQLKGRDGKIYYKTIECPINLAPVKAPQNENKLHCSLN